MALFNSGKKKEERQAPDCCCGASEPKDRATNGCCCASAPEAEERTSCFCGSSANSISSIKVLGAGCKSCHEQYENVKTAVKSIGLSAPVEYITDMEKITAYGVMSMPAIVVNGQVVSMGKVLKTADVEKLLRKLGY